MFRFTYPPLFELKQNTYKEGNNMNTDQLIIEEGKKLIEKYGFRKFTMDELAQNTRISKRTIYQHFRTKNELISSVIDSIIEDDLEELENHVNEGEDYVAKLRAVFFLYHTKMLKKKYVHELRKYFPDDWNKFKEFSEHRRSYVKQIYNDGVEQRIFINKIPKHAHFPMTIGEIPVTDLLIFLLTSIINQAFETELVEDEFDINTMLVYSFEMIISIFVEK